MNAANMNLPILFCCLLLLFALSPAKAQSGDSLELANAASRFLKSFNEFDWPGFRNSFAKDATIFYPGWDERTRRQGKKEIEETWIALFPEFLDSANKSRLTISPKEPHIQLYGNSAIVTFHLGDGTSSLSRRTLVFVKENYQWKIVHLHASRLEKSK